MTTLHTHTSHVCIHSMSQTVFYFKTKTSCFCVRVAVCTGMVKNYVLFYQLQQSQVYMGQNLRYLFSRDYHPFKRLFEGHRGYGVLTHSHLSIKHPSILDSFLFSPSTRVRSAPTAGGRRKERKSSSDSLWSFSGMLKRSIEEFQRLYRKNQFPVQE